MANTKPSRGVATFIVSTILAVLFVHTKGQITTGCTTALIMSFTPCMNYITGSSDGASSPTADCCSSFANVMETSTECGCLIVTGNVPFSLPINQTIGLSLLGICKSKSIPLFQCKGYATTLPAPGPVTFGPSLPPLPPAGVAPAATASMLPPFKNESTFAPAPQQPRSSETQGLKPSLLPNSARKISNTLVSCGVVFAVSVFVVFQNNVF